jgi:glycosyltransferase involved in cell wall biosynthesis
MLEAMTEGVPVVALNHQGAARLVNSECGYLVDVDEPKEVIKRMAAHIQDIAWNPDLHLQLRIGSLLRARRHFSKDRLAAVLISAYEVN